MPEQPTREQFDAAVKKVMAAGATHPDGSPLSREEFYARITKELGGGGSDFVGPIKPEEYGNKPGWPQSSSLFGLRQVPAVSEKGAEPSWKDNLGYAIKDAVSAKEHTTSKGHVQSPLTDIGNMLMLAPTAKWGAGVGKLSANTLPVIGPYVEKAGNILTEMGQGARKFSPFGLAYGLLNPTSAGRAVTAATEAAAPFAVEGAGRATAAAGRLMQREEPLLSFGRPKVETPSPTQSPIIRRLQEGYESRPGWEPLDIPERSWSVENPPMPQSGSKPPLQRHVPGSGQPEPPPPILQPPPGPGGSVIQRNYEAGAAARRGVSSAPPVPERSWSAEGAPMPESGQRPPMQQYPPKPGGLHEPPKPDAPRLVKGGGTAPTTEDAVQSVLESLMGPEQPKSVELAPTATSVGEGATRQSGKFGRSDSLGQPGGYTSGRPSVTPGQYDNLNPVESAVQELTGESNIHPQTADVTVTPEPDLMHGPTEMPGYLEPGWHNDPNWHSGAEPGSPLATRMRGYHKSGAELDARYKHLMGDDLASLLLGVGGAEALRRALTHGDQR